MPEHPEAWKHSLFSKTDAECSSGARVGSEESASFSFLQFPEHGKFSIFLKCEASIQVLVSILAGHVTMGTSDGVP